MTEPLRPLSIGEILDRTFSLYRQNFVLFVGVAILGPLALLAAQLSLAFAGFGGRSAPNLMHNPLSAGGTVLIGMLCYLVGHAISVAATTRAVAAVYLGRPITIAETFAAIQSRVLRVVGVMFAAFALSAIAGGLLVGVGGAAMAAFVAAGRAIPGRFGLIAGGLLGAAVLVASLIGAVAFAIRYALSVQACVVEDLGVRASLARSVVLTKNARKRLMTVMVVCAAIVYVLAAIFGVISLVVPVGGNLLGRHVVSQLFGLVAGALGAPLVTAAMSLVYYDERVRKEAFDLQLLMESLDRPQSANAAEATPSLG